MMYGKIGNNNLKMTHVIIVDTLIICVNWLSLCVASCLLLAIFAGVCSSCGACKFFNCLCWPPVSQACRADNAGLYMVLFHTSISADTLF